MLERKNITSKELTDKEFKSDEYFDEVEKLSDKALESKDDFEKSAKELLRYAAGEYKLKSSEKHPSASGMLYDLFRNSCSKSTMSLKEKILILKKLLFEANEAAISKKPDDYLLVVLLKVLGIAADSEARGEEDNDSEDPNYENYIHFAVNGLLNYAGKNDGSDLCAIAEEELHKLLKKTINDIYSDIPFWVYKFYKTRKMEEKWKKDPICHIKNFEKEIKEQSENKSEKKSIDVLKKRFNMLSDLIKMNSYREHISKDFSLVLGATNPRKVCLIDEDIDPVSGLTLHARQSLCERLISSKETALCKIEERKKEKRSLPHHTYVVVSFGLIISDIPHISGGEHNRIFKTISVFHPNTTILGSDNKSEEHAEESFYEYMLKEKNIASLVAKFKQQHGVIASDHKVYGLVWDFHSTYDMCLSCSKKGSEFQNQFRAKFVDKIKEFGFKTKKRAIDELPVIIRYSSDLEYHYPNSPHSVDKGTLATLEKKEEQDIPSFKKVKKEDPSFFRRNIANYPPNLLIHGKGDKWHSFWEEKKRDSYLGKKIRLETWTAFLCAKKYVELIKDGNKPMNYTKLGMVDTSKPRAETEGLEEHKSSKNKS